MLRRDEIIEAVFDEDAFARLPARLAQSVGARSTILHWVHDDGGYEVLGFSHFTPQWMHDYAHAWMMVDPWQWAGRQRPNEIALAEEFVSQRAFSRSPIFNDFIRAYGDDTLHCMGGTVSTPWGKGEIGVHRGAASKPFEAADVLKLRTYAPELQRLFRIKGELAAARRDASNARATLDALAWAIIIVSADARVVSANAAAERVLRRSDGLVVRQGVLGLASGPDAPLHDALRRSDSAAGHIAESQVVTRPPDLAPYMITISPTPRAGRMMVLFRDPDAIDPSLADRLRGLFDLTPAEAAVAADLAKGLALADVAARRGVKLNTLKTQMSAIMSKMNCRRQSQIVAVVAGLPPAR